MAKFQNKQTNVVIAVPDYKAGRYENGEWQRLDTDAKPARTRTRAEPHQGDGYASWKVPDLKAEIDRRNADRPDDDKIAADGNKAALVATLEASDATPDDDK